MNSCRFVDDVFAGRPLWDGAFSPCPVRSAMRDAECVILLGCLELSLLDLDAGVRSWGRDSNGLVRGLASLAPAVTRACLAVHDSET